MSQSSVHTQTHIANGAIVEIGIEHTQVPLSQPKCCECFVHTSIITLLLRLAATAPSLTYSFKVKCVCFEDNSVSSVTQSRTKLN